MQFTIGNHTSIGKVRTANEDAFGNWMTPNGHLFVVCDGMGGHIGGAIASQSAVSTIYQTIASQRFPSADLAISQALNSANIQIHRLVKEKPDLYNMGTTAVVVLLQGDKAYYGHIGDSRLYLYRNRQLQRLTKDHSFVQTLVNQGHITDEEAEKHPRKNEIYRAIGITDEIEPEIPTRPLDIQAGDQLLLCTDGVNGMIGDRGITSVLANSSLSAQQTAEALIAEADNAGGHDNSTVQILRWTAPATQATIPPANMSAPVAVPPANSLKTKTPEPTRVLEQASTEAPKRSKNSVAWIAGGVVALSALGFVTWSNLRPDPQPKLGQETNNTTVDTATLPKATETVTETPTSTTIQASEPDKTPPVAAAPKAKTEQKTSTPSTTGATVKITTDSAKPTPAAKQPVVPKKTDTVKNGTVTNKQPARKAATSKTPTSAAKPSAPKPATTTQQQPKAVMEKPATP